MTVSIDLNGMQPYSEMFVSDEQTNGLEMMKKLSTEHYLQGGVRSQILQ